VASPEYYFLPSETCLLSMFEEAFCSIPFFVRSLLIIIYSHDID